MSLHRTQPSIRQLLLCPAAILLVACSVTACNATPQATPRATVAPDPTARLYSSVPTRIRTDPEKVATKNARFAEERRLLGIESTRFALGTPYPTLDLYIEPTRRPVPTLATGPLGDCADADRDFRYVGCWAEKIGNEYLIIESGASKPDLSQGMLRVYTITWDLRGYSDVSRKLLYKTPSKSGRVRIEGVNWPFMTLIALDSNPPVTFGFDLTTRQWVSPPPLP